MLTLRGLGCERAERLLFSQLDRSIEAGDIVEVRGPNGAGKSTLLRIIAGLAQDYDGDVLWQGEPAQQCRSEFNAACHYLGHQPAVKSTLTALENLRWLTELKHAFNQQAAEQALADFRLQHCLDVLCYQLSAGQQRRVALASLKLVGASLWILDEPFTALDSEGIDALKALFRSHTEAGGAIVLSTHQSLGEFPGLSVLAL